MKINYLKEWGKDGTVYNQTITIEKEHIKKFNEIVKEEKETKSKKFIFTNEDMDILYGLEELKEGKNYTNLTTLSYFIWFYKNYIHKSSEKDKDFERILWRNTIINVI